jgi:hypothetical protein
MEHRTNPRVDFITNVEIKTGDHPVIHVESRDLSLGGLQVETSALLPIQTACEVIIHPYQKLGLESFALEATVARSFEGGMGLAIRLASTEGKAQLVALLGLLMTHAYTPGLRVTRYTTLLRRRQLPLKGEVLVNAKDWVARDQVVARTNLPGKVTTLNLINILSCSPAELGNYMLKIEGDRIEAGEIIAETKPFIAWFKTSVTTPISGTLESISKITGQVILREPPLPVEIQAYVDGEVVEIIPEEGVVIESKGAFIQGIFGVGGEVWGTLHMLTQSPDQHLTPDQLDARCKGKIVVGGNLLTLAVIQKAREVGALGLIGGGIRDADLRDLLGYDLGVAITGSEQIGITVIVTEGFGAISMARKTFDILTENSGREASMSGATQIRAGVQRPEIIIPNTSASDRDEPTQSLGLMKGALLRVIRAPYFGRVGKVSSLPSELQVVESETRVRVLEVEFEDGIRAIVPRANVELIEE